MTCPLRCQNLVMGITGLKLSDKLTDWPLDKFSTNLWLFDENYLIRIWDSSRHGSTVNAETHSVWEIHFRKWSLYIPLLSKWIHFENHEAEQTNDFTWKMNWKTSLFFVWNYTAMGILYSVGIYNSILKTNDIFLL